MIAPIGSTAVYATQHVGDLGFGRRRDERRCVSGHMAASSIPIQSIGIGDIDRAGRAPRGRRASMRWFGIAL
jgi:hypothetical protein